MTPKNSSDNPNPSTTLREHAEERVRTTRIDISNMPEESIQALVHEFQVHQIELELQNEQLRNAQVELVESRDRYADLYEFAPIGYITLDRDGKILEANLTAAAMLGVDREHLLQTEFSVFMSRDSQDGYYIHLREVLARKSKQICGVQLSRDNRTPFVVRLESVAFESESDLRIRTALVDVTEQMEAEHSLKRLNEELESRVAQRTQKVRLLAQAVANLGEGVMITNDHLDWPGPQIVFVNEAMCRIAGYSADELIGRTPRILQAAGTQREVLNRIKAELAAGGPCLIGLTNYRKDGSPYDAELFITPMFNANGRRTNFVSIHRDVTERKQAEEALRREHELSESIINTAQHIVLLLDGAGRIVRFNSYMEKLTGWRLDEVRGADWFGTFLPDCDRRQTRALFERALGGERTCANVNAIVTRGGQVRDIEWYDAPLTNSKGELIGLLCTGQDITERTRAESILREREERMQAILNTADEAIITIDRSGVIDEVNPATEKMFGYPRNELVGKNVNILMPSPFREEHDSYIARYLKSGVSSIIGVGREVRARRKSGAIFAIELAVSEVDHLGLFTGIVRDITERKRLQQQILDIATEEQRRIGHDLHDDVGQEMTGLGLLANTARTSVQRERLLDAESTLDDLLQGLKRTIGKVRALSRGLNPVDVDAEGLMSALTGFANRISEAGDTDCTFTCARPVRFDDHTIATHLFHIAQEATNNALKHGNAAHVELTLTEQDGVVTLTIRDDGKGIDLSRQSEGLGLRIMQYRADLISAKFIVEPLADCGTLVRCTLHGPNQGLPTKHPMHHDRGVEKDIYGKK